MDLHAFVTDMSHMMHTSFWKDALNTKCLVFRRLRMSFSVSSVHHVFSISVERGAVCLFPPPVPSRVTAFL